MHCRRQHEPDERGATTLEYVSMALAALVLAMGVGGAVARDGQSLGRLAGASIEELVTGEGRWQQQRERRRQGGSVPTRVARDELRLRPTLHERAAWSRRWQRALRPGGAELHLEGSGCALCAAAEAGHSWRTGAEAGSDGQHAGLELGGEGEARAALGSLDAAATITRSLGPARIDARARARAMVGGEARGSATLRLGHDAQDLELEAGATAGAVARAEGQLGVHLLGVAIRQGGHVEGWAGAGARGVVGVRREDERLSWRVGWGAALGLGGAAEWRGSVDVSEVPQRHRRLARDALDAAIRAALLQPPRFHP